MGGLCRAGVAATIPGHVLRDEAGNAERSLSKSCGISTTRTYTCGMSSK